MTTGRGLVAKLSAAATAAAVVAGGFMASGVLAQEQCSITVTPASVAEGQQFVVAGNFGGAEIFLLPGADASPAEGAEPDATTPEGSSFSVTFIAEAGDAGTWTVWALIPETECGDSAPLTITAGTPNTAMAPMTPPATAGLGLLLFALAVLMLPRLTARR